MRSERIDYELRYDQMMSSAAGAHLLYRGIRLTRRTRVHCVDAVAVYFTQILRESALGAGQGRIRCRDPLAPRVNPCSSTHSGDGCGRHIMCATTFDVLHYHGSFIQGVVLAHRSFVDDDLWCGAVVQNNIVHL